MARRRFRAARIALAADGVAVVVAAAALREERISSIERLRRPGVVDDVVGSWVVGAPATPPVSNTPIMAARETIPPRPCVLLLLTDGGDGALPEVVVATLLPLLLPRPPPLLLPLRPSSAANKFIPSVPDNEAMLPLLPLLLLLLMDDDDGCVLYAPPLRSFVVVLVALPIE